jgi:hypothetical protein
MERLEFEPQADRGRGLVSVHDAPLSADPVLEPEELNPDSIGLDACLGHQQAGAFLRDVE